MESGGRGAGSTAQSLPAGPAKPSHHRSLGRRRLTRCISAASRLRLGCISAASRLHLGCISAASRQERVLVETEDKQRRATIEFIGKVPEIAPGFWVGVEFEGQDGKHDGAIHGRACTHVCTPHAHGTCMAWVCTGKHDGSINGRSYYRCKMGHGSFLRPNHIRSLTLTLNPTLPQPQP